MKYASSLLFAIVLLIAHFSYGQKSKTQAKVVDDLVLKLSEVQLPTQPIRLAIVPFTSSVTNNDPKNTFGEYLTELMIGKISENTGRFKLFERSRLDAIFKENELMLSGMMKPSEAIRIGELLPIDALFSGTYTKLKSYIDVSGRLIDVTSGEIISSYSGRIKMSKNLNTLFPETSGATATSTMSNGAGQPSQVTNIQINNNTPEYSPSAEDICRKKLDEFKPLLNDLSSEEKINAIATQAMKTPFNTTCDKLHYEVMYTFKRYKVQHYMYRQFLLITLADIALPSQDDRTLSILEYLAKDGDLSAGDWNVALTAIAKVEYGFYRYISASFEKTDTETGKKRVDDYFRLLQEGKLGLPKPAVYDHAFYQMMQGLGKHEALRLYTYEKYHDKLVTEPDHVVSNHVLYLNRMYEAADDPETKTTVLRWVANYFLNHENKKSPEQLFDFARKFELKENKNNNKSIEEENKEIASKFPAHDLHLLIEMCRDKFTQYATKTEYNSQLEDRIDFCIKYHIGVPGVIPTMTEAEQVLKGSDPDEQLRVLKLLVQMGDEPKPIETALVSLFEKRSLDEKEKLIEIQSYAMEVLGNIKTGNAKAINYMISKIMSFNYKESDRANHAITQIGKEAVPHLLTALQKTTIHEGGLRYKLIVLLGKNGKAAKSAEPTLLKIQKENTNKDIAYAIEAALQEIR